MHKCDFILLILRIVLGICFILHGAQKVFGLFGGSGMKGWESFLSGFNIPPIASNLIAWFEMIAGIFLILGLFSRLFSVGLFIFMLAAIYLVHLKKGYFVQDGGYEYQLTLAIILVIFVIYGPGKISINNL
jgi:putative oxidoreductase